MPYRGTCPYCKRGMDYPTRCETYKCARCLQVSQAPPLSRTWKGDWFWPALIGGCIGAALGWWLLPGVEETLILAGAFTAITVLLVNNGMYGTIRMHQERHFPGRVHGTRLVNPDFDALARAYGCYGERVERTADFAAALERAGAANREGQPALLELMIDPQAITANQTLDEIRQQALGAK